MAVAEAIADSLKMLFDKFVEFFFSVFDVSFFVAGACCLTALAAAWNMVPRDLNAWYDAPHIIVAVGVSYILGVVCFAIGREARAFMVRYIRPSQDNAQQAFPRILASHGLVADEKGNIIATYRARQTDHCAYLDGKCLKELRDESMPFGVKTLFADIPCEEPAASDCVCFRKGLAGHIKNNKETLNDQLKHNLWAFCTKPEASACEHLRSRLWAEIRENSKLAASLKQLDRAWKLEASLDGLAIAALAWAVEAGFLVYARCQFLGIGAGLACAATVFVGLGTVANVLSREANSNERNEFEELVVTYKHWLLVRDPNKPSE